jgi:hypothetical protein
MRKTFNLETTIGRMTFCVNGADQIYVNTIDARGPDGKLVSPTVIRGKEHTGNMHFTLLPNGTWEALTWSGDGNHLIPVDPTSDWAVSKAGYLSSVGRYGNKATDAARRKFYEMIKVELNAFCRIPKNWTEIQAEMTARAVERREGMIETLNAKAEKLRADLAECVDQLNRLHHPDLYPAA